jgi:UDP-N-acetylglucosamine 2-epimerase (non-hydrolysing)
LVRPCWCCATRPNGPEGLAAGNALLVGTDARRIVAEVERLLGDPVAWAGMSHRSLPFGDGRAAPRIARIIGRRLAGGMQQKTANAY